MADQITPIKAHEGLKFMSLNKSFEKGFLTAGYNTSLYVYKIDAVTNTIPASFDFQTDLKRVHDGKIVLLDGVGNASASYPCKAKSGGKLNIANLNGLAAGTVFVIVAVGTRV